MTIEKLTAEDKRKLLKELEAEIKADKMKKEAEIESYKKMQDDSVISLLPSLVAFAAQQGSVVNEAFKTFSTLIEMKRELFTTKEKQDSHTFTARDGGGSITVGYNTIIGFDGTQTAGVQKIKQFIATLGADDKNRETLADLLSTFMKPDKKGNLNPTRIAELVNKEAEINDPLFSEGISTIVKAQFKTRTTMFVKGWQRVTDGDGKESKIQFSISA